MDLLDPAQKKTDAESQDIPDLSALMHPQIDQPTTEATSTDPVNPPSSDLLPNTEPMPDPTQPSQSTDNTTPDVQIDPSVSLPLTELPQENQPMTVTPVVQPEIITPPTEQPILASVNEPSPDVQLPIDQKLEAIPSVTPANNEPPTETSTVAEPAITSEPLNPSPMVPTESVPSSEPVQSTIPPTNLDNLLTPTPSSPSEPLPVTPPPTKSKNPAKGILFAVLALFLLTLPIIGFFVNQRSQQADIRSDAAYPYDCSVDSDSTCSGSDYNAVCVKAGLSGTCIPSTILGSDDQRICSCGAATAAPGTRCTTVGDRTCIGEFAYICQDVGGNLQYEKIIPEESCTILKCNNSSQTGCQNVLPGANCNINGQLGICAVSSIGNPIDNSVCSCSLSPSPTTDPNPPPPNSTPTNTPQGCFVDNPNVVNTYIRLSDQCGSFTLFRHIVPAAQGTTNSQCVGTNSPNPIQETISGGQTAFPTGSCGNCVQIDANINGQNYGTAAYTGDCPVTATNTPAPPQVCQNISIYKEGVRLNSSQYNTIKPGDNLIIATVSTADSTQARFTINDQLPEVVTDKDPADGYYKLNYVVPQVTEATQFSIQAEIYTDGQWR